MFALLQFLTTSNNPGVFFRHHNIQHESILLNGIKLTDIQYQNIQPIYTQHTFELAL